MRGFPWCIVLSAAVFAAVPAFGGVDAEGPAALKAKGSILPAGDVDVFRFEGEAGTLLTFKLAAMKKAPLVFDPVLTGPGEADVDLSGATVKGSKFSVSKLALPATGAYRLEVGGDGTGDYSLSLKAKVKGLKTLKLDVRAAVLGRPGGGEVFLRRVPGAGGVLLAVDDPDCDLDGAELAIPPGALEEGAAVVLASADPPAMESLDRNPAGPAAEVGPSDLVLGAGVTLTLPFDPDLLPTDATAAALQVCAARGGAAPALEAPVLLDEADALFTVALTGACRLAAAVRSGPPRVEAGDGAFWVLSLGMDFDGSADSRVREAKLAHGTAVFGASTVAVSFSERWIRWENRNKAGGTGFTGFDAGVQSGATPSSATLGWTRGAGGEVVLEGDAPRFLPSADGSVFVGRSEEPGSTSVGIDIAVRKPSRTLAMADLAGAWHWGALSLEVQDTGDPANPAGIDAMRMFGTLVLGADGKIVLAGTQYAAETDFSNGEMFETVETFTLKGTAALQGDGSLVFDFGPDPEGPRPMRALPGREGDAMLVTFDAFNGEELLAIIALRQASGFSVGDVAGTWQGGGIWFDPRPYFVESYPVPDFAAGSERLELAFNASGPRMDIVSAAGRSFSRNGETGALEIDDYDDTGSMPLSVTAKGKITLTEPEGGKAVGAASGDGQVAFIVNDPARKGGDLFMAVTVRKP